MDTETTPEFFQEQVSEAIKKEELKRNRLSTLASIFARTNSVLAGKRVNVSVVSNPSVQAPAFSSTHDIWLNTPFIKDDFSARSLISHNGMNFHELSHIKFTPRTGHDLCLWVKENDVWNSFNSLEDMRIENLMVANLPSVAKWLVITIADYLLSDEEGVKFAYAITYGRKYLPSELQQIAIDNFAKPELISQLENLIDEYITFVFDNPDVTERAKEVISEYHNLMNELLPKQEPKDGDSADGQNGYPDPFGHSKRPTQGYESSSNRPEPYARQKKLRDKVQSKSDTTPKPQRKSDTGTSNADTTGSADTKENTKDKINDRNEKVSERTYEVDFDDLEFSDDDDTDTNVPSDYQQAGEKSVGNGKGGTNQNRQVTETISDVISDVIVDLEKEVKSIAKQLGVRVDDLVADDVDTPEQADYKNVNAPKELVDLSKAFGRELERLRSLHEPMYEYETEQGNLNVLRYLNDEDFDTCFDEWQEGRSDVTDIEAVILLDKSGSMSGVNADEAYKSMWAIKRALEEVEARTSVILFDMDTYLLYDGDTKAGMTIRDGGASGGTNPKNSIMYAKNLLANSQKKIKILFMITDGAWETDEGEKAIKEMRNANVLTCQAYLSQYAVPAEHLEPYRHSFELLTHIQTSKDILTLGKNLVRLAIQRNLIAK